MDLPVSPLAPSQLPMLPAIKSIALATTNTGTKYQGRDDLLVVRFPAGTQAAGVYTQSLCPGAPVSWCKGLTPGPVDTLVINAGNANAFTGAVGDASVQAMAQAAGGVCLVSSTGVIGEPLDDAAMVHAIKQAEPGASWEQAADAIRTTDTFAKRGTRSITTAAGQPVILNAIAKGSGMIAPDMATMLGYIFTNAKIPAQLLQEMLSAATEISFNSITVDSDTSTSDTVQLFATGEVELVDDDLIHFQDALSGLCLAMAEMIVRDGEGATKLVRVSVTGAATDASAKTIAMSIANSPLVKTALAGEDANWGRVVMAVGKAGEPADRDKLLIRFGNVIVARNGQRDPDYNEDAATAAVQDDEIEVSVDVGVGEGSAQVLTCDLTHGYISINGDYRS